MARIHLFTKKARALVEARRKTVAYRKAALADAEGRLARAEQELAAAEHDLRLQEELDAQGSGFGLSREAQRDHAAAQASR